MERYVVPALGRKRLAGLTPADVRLFVARTVAFPMKRSRDRTDQGGPRVSARTVQQAHAVLRAMLSQAVREEVISRNVARLVQAPTPNREEIRPWTDAEARAFLSATRDHRLYALFVTALGLGLRRGELLGLRWSDVDLDLGQLRVWQIPPARAGRGDRVRPAEVAPVPAGVDHARCRDHGPPPAPGAPGGGAGRSR